MADIFTRPSRKKVRINPDLLQGLEEGPSPFRVASRHALKMAPTPGVQTYVSQPSAQGLPPDLERNPAYGPASATPGGQGRDIGNFSYNTPDSDSDIQPRTLAVPGEDYGHPVNDNVSGFSRRTMTSSPSVGWHVAPYRHTRAIQEEGLQPRKPEAGVYVWGDLSVARWFQELKEEDGVAQTLWQVDLRGLPLQRDSETFDMSEWSSEFSPGEDGLGYIHKGPISYSRLRQQR